MLPVILGAAALIAAQIASENKLPKEAVKHLEEKIQEALTASPLEGVDDNVGFAEQEATIDTLLIRNETRTIHDVLRRIDKGGFVMHPDFQRDFVWNDDKQSKLIESVLMRIPLPVFYLAEDESGRMVIVDGLQRLTTFQRFLKNQLRLNLPKQADLHNKSFEELPSKLQNRIEDSNLILYVIDAKSSERTRLDIFDRVNSGEPLTRQQMRNYLYYGKGTVFLKDTANTELFKQATGNSLPSHSMMDRELINRFCAFDLLELSQYKGDMDEWLGMALKHMESLEETELTNLRDRFNLSMQNNFFLFGEHTFRKYQPGQTKRNPINASLWDVLSVGLSRYSENDVAAHKDKLTQGLSTLLQEPDFLVAITSGTSSVKNVTLRFQKMNDLLAEVFRAD